MKKDIFNCKIVKPGDKYAWNRCVHFEYDIFVESGYIEKNPERIIPKYEQYKHSLFLVVYPEDKNKLKVDITIAGVLRLFYAPHSNKMQGGLFPILDMYDKSVLYPERLEILMKLDPKETVNVGALALKENFRSLDCFMEILGAFFIFCCENRYLYAFASLENLFLYEAFKKYFTLLDIGPRISFRGAPSILAIIDIFDQLNLKREENNEYVFVR